MVEVPQPAGGGGTLAVGDHSYQLAQWHIHAPSEDVINGHRDDLEIHLVNADAQGNNAVLAIFADVVSSHGAAPQSPASKLLRTVLQAAPSTAGEETDLGQKVSAAVLLGAGVGRSHHSVIIPSYLTYTGSLTTPPCTGGVRWFILHRTIRVDQTSVQRLHTLIASFPGYGGYPNNNRPVQPLGSRTVERPANYRPLPSKVISTRPRRNAPGNRVCTHDESGTPDAEEQNVTREQDLVPVRHGRMMVSPFTFYRGAAKIMAADLRDTPVAGLDAQLCGDAHLSNFGLFASPKRRLLFDLNDFDETLPGPFEYDVKRMAASFAIAGRNNGFAKADARAATLAWVTAYREAMAAFALMGTMDIWYAHLDEDELMSAIRAPRWPRRRKRPRGQGCEEAAESSQEGGEAGEDGREAGGEDPREGAHA